MTIENTSNWYIIFMLNEWKLYIYLIFKTANKFIISSYIIGVFDINLNVTCPNAVEKIQRGFIQVIFYIWTREPKKMCGYYQFMKIPCLTKELLCNLHAIVSFDMKLKVKVHQVIFSINQIKLLNCFRDMCVKYWVDNWK